MEKQVYYKIEPKFNNDYKIVKKEAYNKGFNCFLTEKEAIKDYKKAYKKAKNKYNQIIKEINKIKNNIVYFNIDYYIKGDMYGVYDDGLYIKINIDGYDFKFLF